ncbi:MAG: ADP-ribosylation factor-like protein 2, partial [Paramarteilia canceri]
ILERIVSRKKADMSKVEPTSLALLPEKIKQCTIIDIGGSKVLIEFWAHYFMNADGVVFVIDGTLGPEKAKEDIKLLESQIADERLQRKPVAVLINKSDNKNCLKISDIESFNIIKQTEESKNNLSLIFRPIKFFEVSAFTGDNIFE